jgi:peptidoglycan/LPS O-acetylase OafA/YrhL
MGAPPLTAPASVLTALDVWSRAGWVGVDLFFVLSGFLVAGVLFREYQRTGDVSVGRFLARRGLKIYPAFYVMLGATVAVDRWLARPVSRIALLGEAFFVQNYGHHIWNHTWSLAVEEHFYLLLAALVAATVAGTRAKAPGRQQFAFLVPLFGVVAVLELALRVATAIVAAPWYPLHLAPTHLRLDSLLWGVTLAYLYHFRGRPLTRVVHARRDVILLTSIACLAPCLFLPLSSVFMETVGYTLLYLGFGCVLLLTLHPRAHRAAAGTAVGSGPAQALRAAAAWALAGVGVYSYSIYLWHMPVQTWAQIVSVRLFRWTPTSGVALVLYFVDSIVVGVLMARLIEMPGLALRDRWIPARSLALSAASIEAATTSPSVESVESAAA